MFQQKNIAIIGASSGIGLETARLLQAQGAQLFAYGRHPLPEDLEGVSWHHLDVSQPDITLPGLPDQLH
jgi:NAD(P)-dependent dehydrogenase (short-subunit alcohol dehydrogenase family)